MQKLSIGSLAAGLIFLAGCRSLESASVEPAPWRFTAENTGQVVMVNRDLAYAVLETVVEPVSGQEVLIKREGRRIGRLRVTDQARHPYVVADILEGSVQVRDAVLLIPKGLEETP